MFDLRVHHPRRFTTVQDFTLNLIRFNNCVESAREQFSHTCFENRIIMVLTCNVTLKSKGSPVGVTYPSENFIRIEIPFFSNASVNHDKNVLKDL